MNFQERSYGGEFFRPRPRILVTENPVKILVATSWGNQDESDAVVRLFEDQAIFENVTNLARDHEKIESLGLVANRLRSAAIHANDLLFREINRSEFVTAVEFLGLVFQNGILSWVQIGSPHLLLLSDGRLQPLAYQMDFGWQYNQSSPLVSQGMGIEPSCQFSCGSIHIEKKSELFFVSRGALPGKLFSAENMDLRTISQIFVEDSPTSPFWVGHLTLL